MVGLKERSRRRAPVEKRCFFVRSQHHVAARWWVSTLTRPVYDGAPKMALINERISVTVMVVMV